MNESKCEDCKYYNFEPHEEPCRSCDEGYSNFEMKKERKRVWEEER